MSDYIYYNGELYRCDSELYHYGVKGMKWGVRRAKRQLEKTRSKLNKYYDKARNGDNSKRLRNKINKAVGKSNKLYLKSLTKEDKDKMIREAEEHNKLVKEAESSRKRSKYWDDGKSYFERSEKERKEIDTHYQKEMSIAKQKIKNAKTESEKKRRIAEMNVIEMEYETICTID